MKIMIGSFINSRLNINKKYIINDNYEVILSKLEKYSKNKLFGFKKDKVNNEDFVISSNTSFGIGMSIELNLMAKPISIYGHVESDCENNQILTLKTKLRIEVLVLFFLMIFVYFILFFYGKDFPYWLYILPVFVEGWFYFVYRFQEEHLIEKVEKVLRIKKYRGKLK